MAGTEKTCSCTPSLELREKSEGLCVSWQSQHCNQQHSSTAANINTAEPPWQLLVHQTQGSTEMAIFEQIVLEAGII
jgi:hypothetical protein